MTDTIAIQEQLDRLTRKRESIIMEQRRTSAVLGRLSGEINAFLHSGGYGGDEWLFDAQDRRRDLQQELWDLGVDYRDNRAEIDAALKALREAAPEAAEKNQRIAEHNRRMEEAQARRAEKMRQKAERDARFEVAFIRAAKEQLPDVLYRGLVEAAARAAEEAGA